MLGHELEQAAQALLEKHGYEVNKVLRVDSPGDSRTGCEVILFVGAANAPRIAYVSRDKKKIERVEVQDDWSI